MQVHALTSCALMGHLLLSATLSDGKMRFEEFNRLLQGAMIIQDAGGHSHILS